MMKYSLIKKFESNLKDFYIYFYLLLEVDSINFLLFRM